MISCQVFVHSNASVQQITTLTDVYPDSKKNLMLLGKVATYA